MKICSEVHQEREIKARQDAYRALMPEVIRQLKGLNLEMSPENVKDFQETLALEIWLTPPHWTGWVRCKKCGLRPCEGIFGDEVVTCSFCIPPNYEKWNPREILDPGMIALCNQMDFKIKKAQGPST